MHGLWLFLALENSKAYFKVVVNICGILFVCKIVIAVLQKL